MFKALFIPLALGVAIGLMLRAKNQQMLQAP